MLIPIIILDLPKNLRFFDFIETHGRASRAII